MAGAAKRETREIEIKLRVKDRAAILRRLRGLGARRLSRAREFNVLFDTERATLRKSGRLLRLRILRPMGRGPAREQALLTVKGPSGPMRRYKERRERNAKVSDWRAFAEALALLGYRPTFRYEKIRATFRLPGLPRLLVELDVTPAGTYVELEGPPRQIDRAAHALGYATADYLKTSYLAEWAVYCRQRGRAFGDMLFASLPRSEKLRVFA